MKTDSINSHIHHFIFGTLMAALFICEPVRAQSLSNLSNRDKAQIFKSVLKKEIAKRKELNKGAILLLKNDSISMDWLPIGIKPEFILLDIDEIRSRATGDKEVSFFFFHIAEIEGNKVTVNFGEEHQTSRSTWISGLVYTYRKVFGRWRGKATSGFSICGVPGPEDKKK
ncbi:MAG: hypothetical protein AB1631_12515 [Acidobacteriota bacterium]